MQFIGIQYNKDKSFQSNDIENSYTYETILKLYTTVFVAE